MRAPELLQREFLSEAAGYHVTHQTGLVELEIFSLLAGREHPGFWQVPRPS